LLKDCDAKVSFDPERDFTLECFCCGEKEKPRDLVDMKFGDRVVTRPFCKACVEAGRPVTFTERTVDWRTIQRLLGQLKDAYAENEQLRKALEFYASRPNWHKTVLRKLVVNERGEHGIRQVNLMQSDLGETARKALGRTWE
jgi:hypothetical protein